MIPQYFKPQLAINYDKVKEQPRTLYASEKLDGVRVIFFDGVAYSRTLKPLPNKSIQALAKEYGNILEGCDGEVIAGDLYAVDVLQQSTSFCMNADKVTTFKVYLFDKVIKGIPWINRYIELQNTMYPDQVQVLEHYFVRNYYSQPVLNGSDAWIDLDEFERQVLERGGEGVMLRDAYGLYKFGRSATKCPELQKVKRFDQDEFEVLGYTQFETNQNELQRDERGYAKRSTSKEGKELVEALGSLVLALPDGKTFNAGSGFTQEQRSEFWKERDALIGRKASIQYFGYSKDGYPLLPVFKAFRSEIDM